MSSRAAKSSWPIALRVETPVANIDRQAPRRLDDLLPRAVIERDRQRRGRGCSRVSVSASIDQRDDIGREIVALADDPDSTPLALSSARSLRMKRLSRPISIATSSGGRLQFSDEKL